MAQRESLVHLACLRAKAILELVVLLFHFPKRWVIGPHPHTGPQRLFLLLTLIDNSDVILPSAHADHVLQG